MLVGNGRASRPFFCADIGGRTENPHAHRTRGTLTGQWQTASSALWPVQTGLIDQEIDRERCGRAQSEIDERQKRTGRAHQFQCADDADTHTEGCAERGQVANKPT